MRRVLCAVLTIYTLVILAVPLAVIEFTRRTSDGRLGESVEIAVLLHQTGEVRVMDLEEYVKGVVAAEMPALFHPEALKAQAVAARTYAISRIRSEGGDGCSLHGAADICTDPAHCQAWRSVEEMVAVWGHLDYLDYSRRIQQSVAATTGVVLTYDGRLVDPVYHSSSGGITENSEDVWSGAVPYLRSVPDPYDSRSPHHRTIRILSVKDVEAAVGHQIVGRDQATEVVAGAEIQVMVPKPLSESSVRITERSEAGHVRRMEIGGNIYSGAQFRALLNLPSSRFTVEAMDSGLIVTNTGYGHGVGMSQYGANGMAEAGYGYDDILRHYYTGVDLVRVDY